MKILKSNENTNIVVLVTRSQDFKIEMFLRVIFKSYNNKVNIYLTMFQYFKIYILCQYCRDNGTKYYNLYSITSIVLLVNKHGHESAFKIYWI